MYVSSEDRYFFEYTEVEEPKPEPEPVVYKLRFMARSPLGDIYYNPAN